LSFQPKTNVSAQVPELTTFYLQYYYPEIGAYQELQGKVSDVPIAEPVAESEIRIRGISSVKTNGEPLYIVDGVPQSDISSINPNEVENIEVLKSSATAIYGSSFATIILVYEEEQYNSLFLTLYQKGDFK
jgi:hypothetical protein